MNRLQGYKWIKILTISLILLLLTPQLLAILPVGMESNLYAAPSKEISDREAYTGLAIFVLIGFLSRRARSEGSSLSFRRDLGDISDSELDLLARIIHAEARGEPYRGQVAVGAVVLNRVQSPEFPNSIREVIYQDGQFAPVADGQINLPANEAAFDAALEALSGEDPSLGAIYFYNPRTARTLWWLSTRETIIEIGNHVFAK